MNRFSMGAIGSIAMLALAGCGGGGDGGGGDDSPPPQPVAAAAVQHHLAREPLRWDISGTDSEGVHFRLVLDQKMLDTPGMFPGNGVRGARQQQAFKLYAEGDLLLDTTAIAYYADGKDLPMGETNSDGSCDVMSGTRSIPRTAIVGDSGPMYQVNEYSDCDRSQLLYVAYQHWSVKQMDSTVFYCHDSWVVGIPGRDSLCVETAPDGTIGARRYYEYKVENGSDSYSMVLKNY